MANLSNINNKFLVTTGGNVLIGQTAVVGTSILQVEGSTNAIIRMNSTSGTGGRMDFAHTGSNYGNIGSARNMLGVGNATDMMVNGDSILYLGVGAQHMTILSSGNVGIGDISPQGKLEVNNRNTATGAALFIKGGEDDLSPIAGQYTGLAFGYGGGDIYNNGAILWEFTNTAANGKLHFAVNPTAGDGTANLTDSKMTILDSGNVGIGTLLPDAKLHIYGSASLSEMYLGEDAATDKAGILKYTQGDGSGTGVITLSHYGNTSVTQSLAIKYGGNVGIGTTLPASELQVGGTDVSGTANFNAQFAVLSEATTGYPSGFMFLAPRVATSSNRVLLNQDFGSYFSSQVHATSTAGAQSDTPIVFAPQGGNVGIGTISPTAKLFVNHTADGDKIRWGKNDALVGSVGTYNGVPYIGYQAGAGGGIMFNGTSIEPTALGSSRTTNTNDIGSANHRWRNAYLGGGIYLGGTATANKLDFYEESTWTPVLKDLNGNPATLATALGTYTKIGRQVIANYDVRLSSKASMTGNYVLLTLPFNHAASISGTGTIDKFNNMTTAFSSMAWDITSTVSVAWLMGVEGSSAATSVYVTVAELSDTTKFKGTMIYHT